MSTPARATAMFAAEIREPEGRGGDPWVTLEVPIIRARVNRKDGHTLFRFTYEEPRRIPAEGLVSFYYMGAPVLHFRYFRYGGALASGAPAETPTVRSAASERPPPASQDFGADFAGYAELPDEKWVQLNSTTDCFTLQVRLRKMPPLVSAANMAAARAGHPGAGHVYYVYGVDTLVVHVNQKGALTGAAAFGAVAFGAASDKDRVLAI